MILPFSVPEVVGYLLTYQLYVQTEVSIVARFGGRRAAGKLEFANEPAVRPNNTHDFTYHVLTFIKRFVCLKKLQYDCSSVRENP
jgi:hypothetical protein